MISIGIADDDALVRQTLTDLLSKNDDIVVAWTAKDGQEALDLFHSSEVDGKVQAVLVDIQMPKMDGLALAKALLEENPDIAILILTTFTADSIVDDAMALGVRGFVAKEDGASSLAGAIRQAVAGNLVLSPTSSAIISDQARLWANGSAQPSESTSKQTQTQQSTSPLPHNHPLRTRTGGADACRRRQDQQADRNPAGAQ
jgi:two component luxR family transcriptional regulator